MDQNQHTKHPPSSSHAPIAEPDPNTASAKCVTRQAAPVRLRYETLSLAYVNFHSSGQQNIRNPQGSSSNSAGNINNNVPKQSKVIQQMRCDVCRVDCSSKVDYAQHVSGKKHQRAATLQNCYATPSQIGRMIGQMISVGMICTICNVACYSEEAIAQHLSGKKHAAQKKRTAKSQSTLVDDLETKKRKVVESGTAAVDVRICTVCNVVCNSQTALDSHIAGRKHAAAVVEKHTYHAS